MPNDDCDFFDRVPRYSGNLKAISRLKARWKRVVQPVILDIAQKHVLDLGAHDGRWAYAYAHAGAAHVTAVEGRSNLIKQLQGYPDPNIISKITVFQDDIFSFLESAITQKKKFDVVALLGILYHTSDHFRLFIMIKKLSPKVIIIDGEFIRSNNPIVQFVLEETGNPLNAISQFPGQKNAIVGIPSRGAIEQIAVNLDYKIVWHHSHMDELTPHDYNRRSKKRRYTCFLYNYC